MRGGGGENYRDRPPTPGAGEKKTWRGWHGVAGRRLDTRPGGEAWMEDAGRLSLVRRLVLGQFDDLVQALREVVDRHLHDGMLFLDGGSRLFGGFQRRV